MNYFSRELILVFVTKTPSTPELRDMILDLLEKNSLNSSPFKEMLLYTIELFGKMGLGDDYYGYHNINHELTVTYVTLLVATHENFQNFVTKQDLKHLYVASLLHDFDPQKSVDKPHEESVLRFVEKDLKIMSLMRESRVDPNVVAMLILRTAYPWGGDLQKRMEKKIDKYFANSKFSKMKYNYKEHFLNLGEFLSVCDRLGGYVMGDFLDAMDMVKKNAHALGWDPESMVRRSVYYFEDLLTKKPDMTDNVLGALPITMRQTFMNNVINFYHIREREIHIRASIVYDKLLLVPTIEDGKNTSDKLIHSLLDIYEELPDPLQFKRKEFSESIRDPKSVLITLRVGSSKGEVVGFAKGGPLENYILPSKVIDPNYGKSNTIFLEPLALQMGYWGQGGGPKMRRLFRDEAIKKGYKFLSSLQLREIIERRIQRGDKIIFLQKRDPERLDYFRQKL